MFWKVHEFPPLGEWEDTYSVHPMALSEAFRIYLIWEP
jgi:hypothetical protein